MGVFSIEKENTPRPGRVARARDFPPAASVGTAGNGKQSRTRGVQHAK